jgi:hypothetical protein
MSTMDSVSDRPASPREEGMQNGWVVFAGVMLLVIGSLDALYGLAAVLNNEVVIVGGHGVILADISTWGWVHLILGSCVALTGIGLFASWAMARWAAVFFIAVNAIAQIVWFPAAPLWACLMIALDVVVIYQLTARWQQ